MVKVASCFLQRRYLPERPIVSFSPERLFGLSVTINMYGISDTAGNHLLGNTITYTFDSVNPTKTANPASGSTLRSLPTVTITYSEQVQNADNIGNDMLSGTGMGTLSITGVTYLSGNAYQLSLSGSPGDGRNNGYNLKRY